MSFMTENGLLTPTLKLKRREVVGRHGALIDALIDALYAQRGAA